MSLLGIAWGFESRSLRSTSPRGSTSSWSREGPALRSTVTCPAEMEADLRKIPGVRNVVGTLFDTVEIPEAKLSSVLLNGWVPGSQMFQGIRVLDGQMLEPDDPNADEKEVMVGRVLALNLGKKPGDTLEISRRPYKIAGIYESDSLFENGGLIITLGELRRTLHRPDQVGGFVVSADKSDPEFVRDLGKRIEAKFQDVAASPAVDFVQQESQIKLVKAMAWATSAIAMVLGSIFILNTMMMTVFERTKEIGILRAIGWRRNRIMKLILGESVMLGTAGAIVGSALAFIGVKLVAQFPMTKIFINPDLPPLVLGYGVALGIGLSLVGGLYPAIRASTLDPTEALRHE